MRLYVNCKIILSWINLEKNKELLRQKWQMHTQLKIPLRKRTNGKWANIGRGFFQKFCQFLNYSYLLIIKAWKHVLYMSVSWLYSDNHQHEYFQTLIWVKQKQYFILRLFFWSTPLFLDTQFNMVCQTFGESKAPVVLQGWRFSIVCAESKMICNVMSSVNILKNSFSGTWYKDILV